MKETERVTWTAGQRGEGVGKGVKRVGQREDPTHRHTFLTIECWNTVYGSAGVHQYGESHQVPQTGGNGRGYVVWVYPEAA